MQRTGGQIVVDALKANGVSQVFGVPGESYLPVLDALYDAPEINVTITRHEGPAAMMAEAWGKLTGTPGICLVTRGPGASNAYGGVHVASQDSTPMILLMGQIPRNAVDREAWQEVDVKSMFGDQVKWAAQVNDTARLPEYMARAFSCAMSGRPGPVVLALPEDMLGETADVDTPWPAVVTQPTLTQDTLIPLIDKIRNSSRPLLVVGGESWTDGDVTNLRTLSEKWSLPVSCAFRCQDRFANSHPNYAGEAGLGINPALADAIKKADLVIALGARLDGPTSSGYTLFKSPHPDQFLVHVHTDPQELGRVYQPAMALCSSVGGFLKTALQFDAPNDRPWHGWTDSLNAAYHDWTDKATDVPGAFNMGEAVVWLRDHLPKDSILTNGAGNYTTWLHRFYRHDAYRTQVAPLSGSMGYGLPAGMAAKLCHPERDVVVFAGDGCFQMAAQELGTIAQNGINLIILVINNGMYGTIRMHQENKYPGRIKATEIKNPDYVALAKAYGLNGVRITETDQFGPAINAARTADKATIIEIVTDPRASTPNKQIMVNQSV